MYSTAIEKLVNELATCETTEEPGIIKSIQIIKSLNNSVMIAEPEPEPEPAPVIVSTPVTIERERYEYKGSRNITLPKCKNCGEHTNWSTKTGEPYIYCWPCYHTLNKPCTECSVEMAYFDNVTGMQSDLCVHCYGEKDANNRHECLKVGCTRMIPKQFQFCKEHIVYR